MDGDDVARSYDRVARAYADHFFDELDGKPLDRALLELFAAEVRGRGRVADLGCGPGHLARFLHERGVEVVGIDSSPEMIRVANERSFGVPFEVGSMLALAAPDASFAGIAGFYAIVNLSREQVATALVELRRVLAPGAPLLLSFHLGDERVHLDELLRVAVSLDFTFFPRSFIEPALRAAGLEIEVWLERRPYPAEHPSTRAYVWARRPRG
ncbi:MAG: class I SAM-dependent methyltransferase [Myxococcales bacterium]